MREKLIFLTENDEKWVLHYLVSGKGTIPYQMITDFDSLKRSSEEFFSYEDFYSDLKEKNISKEEYENVKKFCKILKLKTLGDLNRIYDFQDTVILCEIFLDISSLLQKLFKYNAKKCNSASSFSGCVQRLQSKCSIALPTDAEIIKLFERTVMGGYICVNSRVGFDTNLFLKNTKKENLIFKAAEGELKRLSSKIIKMDENNQLGMAVTKPLRYSCIKLKKNTKC